MPILRYKFKSHGKNGKWYTERHKTYASLKRSVKFLGREAYIKIEGRKPKRRSNTNRGLGIPIGNVRLPNLRL